MNIWISCVLFYLGGAGYMTLEFLWRGRSHGSMFLLGGICFTAIGKLYRFLRRLPVLLRGICCGFFITVLELLTGLIVNRHHTVWDYRHQPLNYKGQICPLYTCFWTLLSFLFMGLPFRADAKIRCVKEKQKALYK